MFDSFLTARSVIYERINKANDEYFERVGKEDFVAPIVALLVNEPGGFTWDNIFEEILFM